MNILALLPNKQLLSGFSKEVLMELSSEKLSIISLDETKNIADSDNTIFTLHADRNAGLSNWIANKLKYQQILKRFKIDKIFHFGQLIPVKTNLIQYLVYPSSLQLTDKEIIILQKEKFEFITYSIEEQHHLQKIFPGNSVHFFIPQVDPLYQHMNWDQTLYAKGKYADGEEFFLVNGEDISTEEAVHILKGFSIFKKWQNSNMKIIFIVNDIHSLQEKIANYKYREDVQLVNNPDIEEKASLIASAYMVLHLPHEDSNTAFALKSIQCHIPLLLKSTSTVSNWLNNNAFLISEESVDALGQAFITMYKAENLRANYIDYYQKFSLPKSESLPVLS